MASLIIYDHFLAKGGAENVSLKLAEQFKDSTLVTAYADEALFSKELNSGKLQSCRFQFLEKAFPTLSLFWFYLVKCKINNGFSSVLLSGVFSPLALAFTKFKGIKTVYFHTYPTFIDASLEELTRQHGFLGGSAFWLFNRCYLMLLRKAVARANIVFSNSSYVQSRFEKVGIESNVLFPPVFIDGLNYQPSDGFYLCTSRLEKNKRVELILEAFSQMPDKTLQMVGGGALFDELKYRYKDYNNISFTGWLSELEVKKQYNTCKALICIPENEYFGISPVEAMAAGKCVIGVNEGGLRETLTDDKLGILIDAPITVGKLINTINQFDSTNEEPALITYRQLKARRFSVESFFNTMNSVLRGDEN